MICNPKIGTVVITKTGFDATLTPGYEVISCGERFQYPAKSDPKLVIEFENAAEDLGISTITGNTVGCNDFYEAQCRLDGALCLYTETDKFNFIKRANEEVNIHKPLKVSQELIYQNELVQSVTLRVPTNSELRRGMNYF